MLREQLIIIFLNKLKNYPLLKFWSPDICLKHCSGFSGTWDNERQQRCDGNEMMWISGPLAWCHRGCACPWSHRDDRVITDCHPDEKVQTNINASAHPSQSPLTSDTHTWHHVSQHGGGGGGRVCGVA